MRIKQAFVVFLAMLFCISFSCCSSYPQSKDSETEKLNKTIEDDIWQLIVDECGHIIDFVMVNDFGDDDGVDISVHLDSDVKYAYLGGYFKSITNICKEYSREKGVSFESLFIAVFQKNEPAFIFDTDLDDFYYLADYRSGDSTGYPLKTLDDLVDIFPAMKITEAQSKLPDGIVHLYNEVIDRLYAQPSVSEDVLFEQIASDYNMTQYELRAFMNHYMDVMYGGEYTSLPDDYGFTYIESPESVYTTIGKENGLMDTAMYASGEIIELGKVNKFSYFVLQNNYGSLLIAQDDTFGKIGNTQRWNELKEGDIVTVYFVYLGWIDEDFYSGGNGIYFTCLFDGENISEQREWVQKWYDDYMS